MAFEDLSTTKIGGDGGDNLQNQQQAQQSQAGAISGPELGPTFAGFDVTAAGSVPFQGQGAAGAGGAGGGVGGPDNVVYSPQSINF